MHQRPDSSEHGFQRPVTDVTGANFINLIHFKTLEGGVESFTKGKAEFRVH